MPHKNPGVCQSLTSQAWDPPSLSVDSVPRTLLFSFTHSSLDLCRCQRLPARIAIRPIWSFPASYSFLIGCLLNSEDRLSVDWKLMHHDTIKGGETGKRTVKSCTLSGFPALMLLMVSLKTRYHPKLCTRSSNCS